MQFSIFCVTNLHLLINFPKNSNAQVQCFSKEVHWNNFKKAKTATFCGDTPLSHTQKIFWKTKTFRISLLGYSHLMQEVSRKIQKNSVWKGAPDVEKS